MDQMIVGNLMGPPGISLAKIDSGSLKLKAGRFNLAARRFLFSGAVLAAAGMLASRPALAQDLGIEVGARAPAVTVQSLDGKQIDLGNYIGKTPMLIEFWATWCPNCRELMPALLDAEKKFGKQVKFVAIAVAINQSPERVRRFLAAHPLPHDTFYDVEGKAAGAFDAPATSYVVVLDKTGRVVYTGVGGKQNLKAALRKAL